MNDYNKLLRNKLSALSHLGPIKISCKEVDIQIIFKSGEVSIIKYENQLHNALQFIGSSASSGLFSLSNRVIFSTVFDVTTKDGVFNETIGWSGEIKSNNFIPDIITTAISDRIIDTYESQFLYTDIQYAHSVSNTAPEDVPLPGGADGSIESFNSIDDVLDRFDSISEAPDEDCNVDFSSDVSNSELEEYDKIPYVSEVPLEKEEVSLPTDYSTTCDSIVDIDISSEPAAVIISAVALVGDEENIIDSTPHVSITQLQEEENNMEILNNLQILHEKYAKYNEEGRCSYAFVFVPLSELSESIKDLRADSLDNIDVTQSCDIIYGTERGVKGINLSHRIIIPQAHREFYAFLESTVKSQGPPYTQEDIDSVIHPDAYDIMFCEIIAEQMDIFEAKEKYFSLTDVPIKYPSTVDMNVVDSCVSDIKIETNRLKSSNPYIGKTKLTKKGVTYSMKNKTYPISEFIVKNKVYDSDAALSIVANAEAMGDFEIIHPANIIDYDTHLANAMLSNDFNSDGLPNDKLKNIVDMTNVKAGLNYYEIMTSHMVEAYALGFGASFNQFASERGTIDGKPAKVDGKFKRVYMEDIWSYVNDGVTSMLSVSQIDSSSEVLDELYSTGLSIFIGKGKGVNIIPAAAKFLYDNYFYPIFLSDPEFDKNTFPHVVFNFLKSIHSSASQFHNLLTETYGALSQKAHDASIQKLKSSLHIILDSIPYQIERYVKFENLVSEFLKPIIDGDKEASDDLVGDICNFFVTTQGSTVMELSNISDIRELIERYIHILYPSCYSFMEQSVQKADYELFSQYFYYSFCFTQEERTALKEALVSNDKDCDIRIIVKNRIISNIVLYAIQASYVGYFEGNYGGELDPDHLQFHQLMYGFSTLFLGTQTFIKSEDDITSYNKVVGSRLDDVDIGSKFPHSENEFLIMTSVYNEGKVPISYMAMYSFLIKTALPKYAADRDLKLKLKGKKV